MHFICYPELRVQTSVERFRIPDLCLIAADAPWERVVQTAPLVCLEILSPEDTMSRTMVRVREFVAMGVREVWVFDPEARVAQVCGGTMTEYAGGHAPVAGNPVRDVRGRGFQRPAEGMTGLLEQRGTLLWEWRFCVRAEFT